MEAAAFCQLLVDYKLEILVFCYDMIITNVANQSIFKWCTKPNSAAVQYTHYLSQNRRCYVWFVGQD